MEVETAETRHVNKPYPCPCPHPEPEPEPEPQKQDRSEVAAATRQPPLQQRTARRTARWRAVRRALKKILSPGERRNDTADTSTPASCSPRTGARTRARTLFDALARLALQRRLAAASHSGKRAHASGENVLRRAVGSTRISGPVFGTGGLASSPPGRVGLGAGLAEGSVRARPGLAVEVETAEKSSR